MPLGTKVTTAKFCILLSFNLSELKALSYPCKTNMVKIVSYKLREIIVNAKREREARIILTKNLHKELNCIGSQGILFVVENWSIPIGKV